MLLCHYVVLAAILHVSVQAAAKTRTTNDELTSPASYLARGYASTLDEHAPRLTIIHDSLLTESVCDGAPVVIRKSSTVPPNGGCLATQSRYNLSCSCLAGYAHQTHWDFKLQAPDAASHAASPVPMSMQAGTIVAVTSLMLLDVPSTGTSAVPMPVQLEHAPTGDTRVAIVRADDGSALTSVDLVNLDLAKVPIDATFVPTTLTKLSMRTCNLHTLAPSFLESFHALESLDLTGNNLSSLYTKLPASPEAMHAMTEILVPNNSLTTLPLHLLQFPNLQTLDVRGNRITNRTISSQDFATLSHLAHFYLEPQAAARPPAATDCPHGDWQQVHDATFCVVSTAPSTSNSSSSTPELVVTDNTQSWTLLLLLAALGGCLVGFLLFCSASTLFREPKTHAGAASTTDEDDSVEHVQTPRGREDPPEAAYTSLHATFHAGLLTNPVMLAHRLEYHDVRLGRCMSKGGFGLVYRGMYKHRRVAIKKIRRDKCEHVAHLRVFVREIALLASLRHDRIVEFIGVAWDSLRNLCAVTEYMDRGDLRDVLYALKCHGSPLDTTLTWHGQKLTIALHIAQGLAYMHSRSPKVIHRDLKSKNVLLNDAYDAKLSDFGVSRARPTTLGEHKSSPTNAATFMTPGVGTSFWIAPEVLLGKEYDEQADVFSFGVVLSELDTDDYPYWNSGHVPGGQGDPTARRAQEQKILEKVARGSLRPTFYNDCPAGILALAASCLDGRPEKRPSAAQVVCTLSELRSHLHTHDEYPQAEPEPDAIVTAGFLLNE